MVIRAVIGPDYPFNTVTLNFINALPRSNGFESIMVVIDQFSKYETICLNVHDCAVCYLSPICVKLLLLEGSTATVSASPRFLRWTRIEPMPLQPPAGIAPSSFSPNIAVPAGDLHDAVYNYPRSSHDPAATKLR
ncbi:hypothetical protein KSP39_PZI006152 [Platanthera zijinensis]|uniref:Uncharacterized protein n=1 Tax=Platanthera zijinensis TaxID=2320716 RepID=A0AAP0BSA0_9ASPA